MKLNKITYDITDANGKHFTGWFLTFHTTPRRITAKILHKHPEISVPFQSHDVKVTKA